jgi:hypothetical protein
MRVLAIAAMLSAVEFIASIANPGQKSIIDITVFSCYEDRGQMPTITLSPVAWLHSSPSPSVLLSVIMRMPTKGLYKLKATVSQGLYSISAHTKHCAGFQAPTIAVVRGLRRQVVLYLSSSFITIAERTANALVVVLPGGLHSELTGQGRTLRPITDGSAEYFSDIPSGEHNLQIWANNVVVCRPIFLPADSREHLLIVNLSAPDLIRAIQQSTSRSNAQRQCSAINRF